MAVASSSSTSVSFLSTPSAGRATQEERAGLTYGAYFYPRPPRGGRLGVIPDGHAGIEISIHALREEGDVDAGKATIMANLFLSTPSARRATRFTMRTSKPEKISIHALREEGDGQRWQCPVQLRNFYPRPPRGGRQQKQRQNLYFQTNYTTFCTNLEEL